MALPVVAIVGRPNVGKSTLFNKLTGKRISIIEDTPGVTRDRIYSSAEWAGHKFMLVDTGGIETRTDNTLLYQMRMQAELAIEKADVIIFVVDVLSGVTATDADISAMLIKSGKPVVVCVNKCDGIGDVPPEFYEFYNMGISELFPVSSVHGHGTGDLLDRVISEFPEYQEEEQSDRIKVAFIGKPNVGKSSLVNKIAGEQRVIVSDIAGTTRDATDTDVDIPEGSFTLIDTAGLRKKSKVTDALEKFSVLRSYMAVDRADVAVIVIDALEGFTEQDSKVAGYAHEQGKACIVAVNKWDAVEGKTDKTMKEMRDKLEHDFSFMAYVPFIFISAKTGQRLSRLFELVKYVNEQNSVRIATGMLNDVLANATARVEPPSDKGKRLKIYYVTQASTKPPTFVFFVNRAELFHFSYQRYLENQIRQTFGLEGTPIKIIVRERNNNK